MNELLAIIVPNIRRNLKRGLGNNHSLNYNPSLHLVGGYNLNGNVTQTGEDSLRIMVGLFSLGR